jgi:hypothetical protein
MPEELLIALILQEKGLECQRISTTKAIATPFCLELQMGQREIDGKTVTNDESCVIGSGPSVTARPFATTEYRGYCVSRRQRVVAVCILMVEEILDI